MSFTKFRISYTKNGKPTSKRYQYYQNFFTYSEIMIHFVEKRAEMIYGMYFYSMIGDDIQIERMRANRFNCQYSIKFLGHGKKKIKEEGMLEIETLVNDSELDICEQLEIEQKTGTELNRKKKRIKNHPKWFLNETWGLQGFLLLLDREGSLKNMKKHLSRTQIYRYKRKCNEMGYMKEDKIVKKLFYYTYE